MPSYGYLIYQAERAQSPAEQRAADAQLGRFFAGLAQWRRALTRPARGLRRQPGAGPAGARAGGRACVPADRPGHAVRGGTSSV